MPLTAGDKLGSYLNPAHSTSRNVAQQAD